MIKVKFKSGFDEQVLFNQICRLVQTYKDKHRQSITGILEFRIDDLDAKNTDDVDINKVCHIYEELLNILEDFDSIDFNLGIHKSFLTLDVDEKSEKEFEDKPSPKIKINNKQEYEY